MLALGNRSRIVRAKLAALYECGELWQVAAVPSTSVAVSEGVRVTVRAVYVPEQSVPGSQRYVFAYTISVTNEGSETAQLKSRHWVISDATGKIEEVRGPGVVGKQPVLRPGEQFEYTSGCVLQTPRGAMHGTYQMVRADGRPFDAEVAKFDLELPYSLN